MPADYCLLVTARRSMRPANLDLLTAISRRNRPATVDSLPQYLARQGPRWCLPAPERARSGCKCDHRKNRAQPIEELTCEFLRSGEVRLLFPDQGVKTTSTTGPRPDPSKAYRVNPCLLACRFACWRASNLSRSEVLGHALE